MSNKSPAGKPIKTDESLYEMVSYFTSHYSYSSNIILPMYDGVRSNNPERIVCFTPYIELYVTYKSSPIRKSLIKSLSLSILEYDNVIDIHGNRYKNVLNDIRSKIMILLTITTDLLEALKITDDHTHLKIYNDVKLSIIKIINSAEMFLLFVDGLLMGKLADNILLYEMTQKYS